MKRIFSVRLNLDEMSASLEFLEGDAALAEWLRGFRYGLRGAASRWETGPGAEGYRIGAASLREAQGFQIAKSEGGKRSAQSRKETHGTAQPARTQIEDNSKTLRTQIEDTSIKNENLSNQSLNVNPLIVNRGNVDRGIEESKDNHAASCEALDIKTLNDLPWDQKTPTQAKVYSDFIFGGFWKQYGKKTGKKDTLREWAKLTEIEKVSAFGSLDDYLKAHPDVKYRKDPVRFLRGRHWEDEVKPSEPDLVEGSPEWWNFHARAIAVK